MKSKFLVLAALGLATASQAATFDVYITGSTAGRSSVHTAIQNILTGETTTQDNASLSSANRANFTGGTFGGDTYNVFCSWSGSAAGVGSLVNNSNVAYMVETSGGVVGSPTTFNHTADIAFSDVFQSSTSFGAVALNDFTTVVLPFMFMTSEGSPVTNVTPQLAQYLYQSGLVPLALFTGLAADEGKGVVSCGRDNGSGTRITTMAETGVGAFSSLVQFQPTLSFTNVAVTGAATTNGSAVVTHSSGPVLAVNQPIRGTGIPAGAKVLTVDSATQFTMTVNATATGTPGDIRGGQNISSHTNVGNGGASSGGTVASYAAATTEGLTQGGKSPCFYVTYLGLGDLGTALTNGAVQCQYNGVTYSADNVRNGLYSLWGYLHLFTRPDVNAGAEGFAAQLTSTLDGLPGGSGLQLSTMRVSRLADGGNVLNDY